MTNFKLSLFLVPTLALGGCMFMESGDSDDESSSRREGACVQYEVDLCIDDMDRFECEDLDGTYYVSGTDCYDEGYTKSCYYEGISYRIPAGGTCAGEDSSDDDATCMAAGYNCTSDPCCSGNTCVNYGGSIGTACGANCNSGSGCNSGCCVPLESGNGAVCAPSDYCG